MDEHLVLMMWSLAQTIWFELGISGAASMMWGQVDVESKKGYYHAMAAGFFVLRLCNSDWKAEQITIDNYTLWLIRWRAQTQFPTGPAGTGHQSTSKRVRNTSMIAEPSKKSRVKSVSTSNIHVSPKCTHISNTQSGNLVNQDYDNVPKKQAMRM